MLPESSDLIAGWQAGLPGQRTATASEPASFLCFRCCESEEVPGAEEPSEPKGVRQIEAPWRAGAGGSCPPTLQHGPGCP